MNISIILGEEELPTQRIKTRSHKGIYWWNLTPKKSEIGLSLSMKVKSLSRVWLFATPWTVAHQAPLSMGFSRQEYWSGLPFPSPGKSEHTLVLSRFSHVWLCATLDCDLFDDEIQYKGYQGKTMESNMDHGKKVRLILEGSDLI